MTAFTSSGHQPRGGWRSRKVRVGSIAAGLGEAFALIAVLGVGAIADDLQIWPRNDDVVRLRYARPNCQQLWCFEV